MSKTKVRKVVKIPANQRGSGRDEYKMEVVEMPANQSGFGPVEYKVLVLPDAKYANRRDKDGQSYNVSSGGIFIPQEVNEREQGAAAEGTLVAVGGRAFEDFGDPCPAIGDGVIFGRYGGQMFEGRDGQEYRLLNDKDIVAVVL